MYFPERLQEWLQRAAKLSANLQSLLWCTYLGGSGDEEPRGGIGIDGSDNIYVSGQTDSSNFPTTAGAYSTTPTGIPNGYWDAFVTRLDPRRSAAR